jgi:serine protease Do
LPVIGYCQVSPAYNDETIPQVIKAVSPCVVGIIGNHKDMEDSAYNSKYSEDVIHGTGVIIKANGEILTNAHVVNEMDKIIVVLADGSGYEATLKCIDEESDLATVKIKKTGLPTAKLGNEKDIIIGKTVIAIGNPISISLRNSASIGIISGVNRGIDSFYKLIQTDAAINPGNSGGPLVNLKGEVIGINSSKFMGSGIEGMGFSIPISTVKYVIGQFDKFGKLKRPYMGAIFEEGWAAKIGLPSLDGLSIVAVEDNSPAKAIGLKDGDILYSINSIKVNSIVDLNEELKKYLPGATVKLGIKRGNSIQSFSIKLSEEN